MLNMKKSLVLAAVFYASVAVSFAQISSQQQQQQTGTGILQSPYSETGQLSAMKSQTTSMFTSSSDLYRNLQTQGVTIQPSPYDASVDTNTYVLGPGDLLNVGVWGATPTSYTLSVTPEGTLVIPLFGVLKVGGMTLAEAKAVARKRLGEQFKKAEVTLTLVYPRSFYVVIAGEVKTPARYIATAFDRVDRVFTLSNLRLSTSDSSAPPPFSLRKIKLIHNDGTTQNVDLLKFYQAGDVSADPYLRQGDAIVVPLEDFAQGSLSISGAVKMQGTYEYVPGDRLRDLLEICQGVTSVADSARVEVFAYNGEKYEEKIVDLKDTSALDLPLPSNSRVVVPIDRKKMNNYYVWVTGEVRAPGIYPISPDSTKLSEMIGMAGGFTRWASLPDAVIYRTSEPNVTSPSRQPYPSWFVNRATDISAEALGYASNELNMRAGSEVVSTDFVKLFADKDEKYDCYLQSGDSIFVPQSLRAVYVFGQVKYPGYVAYHVGWSYSDYVSAAGGVTEGAEEGDTKILKHGTYQWYNPGETHLESGDLVFVPRVSIKPELYSWNLIKDIIGTVGSVASIALTAILVIRTAQGK